MLQQGDLPTVQWFRKNGLAALTTAVHKSGRRWEDLRQALGLRPSGRFYESRNGMRWRSTPEACLSNFLHARGIEHKRGESYPTGFQMQSGMRFAKYDLHFVSQTGEWVDVEIWGNIPEYLWGGRYATTRKRKERWHGSRRTFLGIEYVDCLSDSTLALILEPYIGTISPTNYEKPYNRKIETAAWSNADELIVTCKELATRMPDGLFPSESWLRKRGKYVKRPGDSYNTLAVYINRWLGGIRHVRELLGQADASTISWTRESSIRAWRAFEKKHGISPSQCNSMKRRHSLSSVVANEGHKIYAIVRKHGALEIARRGRSARKIKWTPKATLDAWKAFVSQHDRSPTECMGKLSRRTMPRDVTEEATRIYGAARRLGLLDAARRIEKSIRNQPKNVGSGPH